MKCESTFYEQKIKVSLSHNIFRQWNQLLSLSAVCLAQKKIKPEDEKNFAFTIDLCLYLFLLGTE